MTTMTEMFRTAGLREQEPLSSDKWVVFSQQGSRGVMNEAVAKLKAAGIPAFFSAGKRQWGVLADEVSE